MSDRRRVIYCGVKANVVNIWRGENMNLEAGVIVAIPLFMTHDGKSKLKKEDCDKLFAFARVIEEEAGKVLIEIFQKTGNLKENIDGIVSSGLLMKPLYTIWSGVRKRRWKVVSKTINYDKINDSSYNSIQLVLGGIDDLRVWSAKDNSEKPITRGELHNYQLMGIYTPIQIEMKIIKKLGIDTFFGCVE